MINGKWLYAQCYLGSKTILHYLRFLWPLRRRAGLDQFVDNYVLEGAALYSASHRAVAHESSRCTTCGSCDAACPLLHGPVEFLGPMRLVASGFRGGPTLRSIHPSIQVMTFANCQTCKQCELACPERIPILRLAAEFQAQIESLN